LQVALTHCPDTIIGGAGTAFRGISGGEKKRLAFGTELLSDPSIIFADEPTSGEHLAGRARDPSLPPSQPMSRGGLGLPVRVLTAYVFAGLDSFMTRGVCTTMRKLADAGKIIMCVIHQPSSQTFDLFTHLLLLAKGRTVYNGPVASLKDYFSAQQMASAPLGRW
jgi:ATP-binding cassette, subfamily G (WHITE), eye pigment precursor transporter